MDNHEHAQHIFSMMLAGIAASGKPLPSPQESEKWAQMAIAYAVKFSLTKWPAAG